MKLRRKPSKSHLSSTSTVKTFPLMEETFSKTRLSLGVHLPPLVGLKLWTFCYLLFCHSAGNTCDDLAAWCVVVLCLSVWRNLLQVYAQRVHCLTVTEFAARAAAM